MGVVVVRGCEDFWVYQACVSAVVLLIVQRWLRWVKRRRGAIVDVASYVNSLNFSSEFLI